MSDSAPPLAIPLPVRQKQIQTKRQPRFNVVLWNDEDHTYEYVIEMLKTLFGFPTEKGYTLAVKVDEDGKAVCLTTTLEHAELKRDQIHSFGSDQLVGQCQGSMSATIEAVP